MDPKNHAGPEDPQAGGDATEPTPESTPEPAPGPAGEAVDGDADDLRARLGFIEAEADDLRTRLSRARADYDNLQKRQQRDAALERERVKARFLEGFLRVYEYATMAEAEAERTPGPLAQGVKMVVGEFRRLLEDEGVQTVGAVGDAFVAALHEAVGEEAADGVAPGHVARVVRPGYLLGERVLRYAHVAVVPAGEGGGPPSED